MMHPNDMHQAHNLKESAKFVFTADNVPEKERAALAYALEKARQEFEEKRKAEDWELARHYYEKHFKATAPAPVPHVVGFSTADKVALVCAAATVLGGLLAFGAKRR